MSIPQGAIFSNDGRYRYALWRVWNIHRPLLLQIGLNPSKAGALNNDPTITRGEVRAYKAGFGGLLQGNLYGYISTMPKVLLGKGDYVGVENDNFIRWMICASARQLCGWGSFPPVYKRAPIVLAMITDPYCLGVNTDGQPKHPLYISYDTPMKMYAPPAIP